MQLDLLTPKTHAPRPQPHPDRPIDPQALAPAPQRLDDTGDRHRHPPDHQPLPQPPVQAEREGMGTAPVPSAPAGVVPKLEADRAKLRVQEPRITQKRTLSAIDQAIRTAHALTTPDLQALGEAIASLLEARLAEELRVQKAQTTETRTLSKPSRSGSFERKIINKCGPYLYLRWWSAGKHRSTYLGKAPKEEP